MTNKLTLTLGLLLAAAAFPQGGRTIRVDVNYTGSGTVDAKHKIYVFLWDTPDIMSSMPIGVQNLETKNGAATFINAPSPAYITTVYDAGGTWDVQSAPPSGSPLGLYGANPPTPDPIKTEPGKTSNIKLSFDDSYKMP